MKERKKIGVCLQGGYKEDWGWETGVHAQDNNSYYQNTNILMRNAITLKNPPLSPSLTNTINPLNPKSHFFRPQPTQSLKASLISECISRTIDQIQQKICDISVEFDCRKRQQDVKGKQIRKSVSSCFEENKENRTSNHARPRRSKEIMFGRTSLFWKENDNQSSQSSLEDTCFSQFYNSKELSQQISCDNFRSNCSTDCRNQTPMPKILMTRRQKAAGNASESQRGIEIVRKGEVKRLISQLNHQIVLDEMLMDAKQWFSQHQNSRKWKQLQIQLKKLGMEIGQLGLKSIFMVNSDEESTYCHFSQDDSSISDLAYAFYAAEQNWQQNILHQFCPKSLKLQNFVQSQLDLNAKGHISIQDLVFYINNHLHTFYQNRQLRLIFKRLKKTNILPYKDLMTSLSKTQLT